MGEQWISTMQSEVNNLNLIDEAKEWKKKSIYKVPEMFTMINREAYVPKLASFGPFHHGHPRLLPMEAHKRRALAHFLARGKSSVGEVVMAVRQQVQQLMDSYDGLDEEWKEDEDRFLEMMILDGCFMMEVLLVFNALSNSYDWRDPVFRKNYVIFKLMGDMLLLENQLPLHLLTCLIAFGGDEIKDKNPCSLILNFFAQTHVGNREFGSVHIKGLHVLDKYRNALLRQGNYSAQSICAPRSAAALREAGVKFECSRTKGFKDIGFDQGRGKLNVPPIDIDHTTEATLRNLIAYESVHGGQEVIAYVFFMDGLIDTAKDVALLREKKIIKGWFGSDEYIAKLFNNLTNEVTISLTEHGVDVNKQLGQYCDRNWNQWRALFVRLYLKNPWAFISLLAAAVLLILTAIQTVYSVLSYYHS